MIRRKAAEHKADVEHSMINQPLVSDAPKTTRDEAIAIAKQLRLDQGRDKLLAFLESLKG
jgi:hypothetical protein